MELVMGAATATATSSIATNYLTAAAASITTMTTLFLEKLLAENCLSNITLLFDHEAAAAAAATVRGSVQKSGLLPSNGTSHAVLY